MLADSHVALAALPPSSIAACSSVTPECHSLCAGCLSAPGSQAMKLPMTRPYAQPGGSLSHLPSYCACFAANSLPGCLRRSVISVKIDAQRVRRASPRHARTSRIDQPRLPSKKFIQLVLDLPHSSVSLLTHLRTGHALLQQCLHRIGKADSPRSGICNEVDECHPLPHIVPPLDAGNALRLHGHYLVSDVT